MVLAMVLAVLRWWFLMNDVSFVSIVKELQIGVWSYRAASPKDYSCKLCGLYIAYYCGCCRYCHSIHSAMASASTVVASERDISGHTSPRLLQ